MADPSVNLDLTYIYINNSIYSQTMQGVKSNHNPIEKPIAKGIILCYCLYMPTDCLEEVSNDNKRKTVQYNE